MPLRVTLRQLEYFVAVCDSGSIAAAALKVNVSSPTISTAIAQLEAEFGINLFVRRHAQSLSLSHSGFRFLAGAREALAKAQSLTDLANDIVGEVRGELRVGCLLTFAQIVLPKLRRSFVDLYPDVVFHQYERDQSELLSDLRMARLDVALTYDLNITPEFTFLPLAELAPFALFGADHPMAMRSHVSPMELVDHPMVLLDLPMSTDYFLSFFTTLGLRPDIVERTRDISVMRSLVANGFGYSVANIRFPSSDAPDGGKLHYVPLSGAVRSLRMGLLMTAGGATSRTVAAFVSHAQQQVTQASGFGLNTR